MKNSKLQTPCEIFKEKKCMNSKLQIPLSEFSRRKKDVFIAENKILCVESIKI